MPFLRIPHSIRQRFVTPQPPLPLMWNRIIWITLLFISANVSGSLSLKILAKQNRVKDHINRDVPDGYKVDIDYSDVKTATICLFITNHLMTFTTSHIIVAFIEDTFHVVPKFILGRMRVADKQITTFLLPHQAIALVISTISVVIPLIFLTFFVFTREATLVVKFDGEVVPVDSIQSTLDHLGFSPVYKDTQYIAIVAEFPWVGVALAIPSTIVTFLAWHKHARAQRRVRRHSSVPPVETLDNPSAIELEDKSQPAVYVESVSGMETHNNSTILLDHLGTATLNIRETGGHDDSS